MVIVGNKFNSNVASSQEGKELIYNEDDVKELGNLYDPCYLLPLFSTMLRPGGLVTNSWLFCFIGDVCKEIQSLPYPFKFSLCPRSA